MMEENKDGIESNLACRQRFKLTLNQQNYLTRMNTLDQDFKVMSQLEDSDVSSSSYHKSPNPFSSPPPPRKDDDIIERQGVLDYDISEANTS